MNALGSYPSSSRSLSPGSSTMFELTTSILKELAGPGPLASLLVGYHSRKHEK